MSRTVEVRFFTEEIPLEYRPINKQEFGINHNGGLACCVGYQDKTTIFYTTSGLEKTGMALSGTVDSVVFEEYLQAEVSLIETDPHYVKFRVSPYSRTHPGLLRDALDDRKHRILSDYGAMKLLANGYLTYTSSESAVATLNEAYETKRAAQLQDGTETSSPVLAMLLGR